MKHLYKNYLTILSIALMGMMVPLHASAQEKVTVNPNEVVIIVHGIVCSFCSQGVTKKLSKLPFVDPSKYTKGIKVDIENQKVIVAIKPNLHTDFDQIFSSIKSGGYEPITAYTADAATITPKGN